MFFVLQQVADYSVDIAVAVKGSQQLKKLRTEISNTSRELTTLNKLANKQSDKKIEHKGPPINIAFDKNGKPTKAAEAFAKKYNTSINSLDRKKTNDGEWLSINTIVKGKKIRIWKAKISKEKFEDALPGKLVKRNETSFFTTKDGCIEVLDHEAGI